MQFIRGKGHFQPKIELKTIDGEGIFTGYGSVFDVLDDQGDRVVSGAFQNSIRSWGYEGKMPKMLWQHESKQPIGYWTHIQEDDRGLYVEGRLLLDLQRAREAYSLMKAEVLDGLSIGYQVVDFHQDHAKGERFLTQVDLLEVSLVTFAANQHAKILSLKSKEEINQDEFVQQEIEALKNLISE